jgi:Flp pilus assembly CpaF family ATPase
VLIPTRITGHDGSAGTAHASSAIALPAMLESPALAAGFRGGRLTPTRPQVELVAIHQRSSRGGRHDCLDLRQDRHDPG